MRALAGINCTDIILRRQAFPVFLTNDGFKAFYFFMAFNICLALFCFFLLPETKGVALEDIDAVSIACP